MDGLLHFYNREKDEDGLDLGNTFVSFCNKKDIHLPLRPYGASGDHDLIKDVFSDKTAGITMTATGFYGPQSRQLRAKISAPEFFNQINHFRYKDFHVTNMEMETAAIYGLAKELNHRALSINAILANRMSGIFADDPAAVVERMIEDVLERLSQL